MWALVRAVFHKLGGVSRGCPDKRSRTSLGLYYLEVHGTDEFVKTEFRTLLKLRVPMSGQLGKLSVGLVVTKSHEPPGMGVPIGPRGGCFHGKGSFVWVS